MLPTKQEADEIGGANRFDFTAELSQRQAMNTRQENAIAPLLFAPVVLGKSPAQNQSLSF
jgi:hypothetical protein